jgi:hypothetical protein
VYVWADGVYLQARMEEAAECMLVLIGATPEGKKELVGFQTGCARVRRAGVNSRRHQAAWARDCDRLWLRRTIANAWLDKMMHGTKTLRFRDRQTRPSPMSITRCGQHTAYNKAGAVVIAPRGKRDSSRERRGEAAT